MVGRRALLVISACLGLTVVQTAGSSVAPAAGTFPQASAVRTQTPERLFATVSPGLVKIVTSCKSGLFVGSGFLVGPRTLVTALHVLRPPDAVSCQTASSVKQEGTGAATLIDHFDAYKDDDLAVAHLSAPITGFYFGLAPKQPAVGTGIVGLGYSLGNPLSFNQGTVIGFAEVNQVAFMEMNLLGAGGSSGGPILNLQGQVVGLSQQGIASNVAGVILSIDFGTLAPKGKALCQGVAKESPSTLCGSIKPSAVTTAPVKTATKPALAHTLPPTLEHGSVSARAYNAHTITDKANHIPSPQLRSGDSVNVPAWNGYLRLALIANQDPYGRRYQATYVRCWSTRGLSATAQPSAENQVFNASTGPLGSHLRGSAWINVSTATCTNAAKAARGQLTQTDVVALGSVLHETFSRQGIKDEGDLTCLGAVGVWEAVNRRAGAAPANRAWSLLLDWYSAHLGSVDLRGFGACVTRFNTDWNG